LYNQLILPHWLGTRREQDYIREPKIMVVVPTYNEANNLASIAGELLALGLPGLEMLIVDDDSPDGTGQIADNLAQAHPERVHVMHRSGVRGLGTAYVNGFRYALDRGADLVVQMDADFSHSPGYIPQFVAATEDYDVIIGSRYVSGGGTDDHWGWWRVLLSWWANFYARLILGMTVKDATAGFKCWRRETLEGIGLDRVRSNGYVFQVEMAYLTEKLGYRFLEIPIYFEDRRIGQSKMTVPVKVEAALRTWQLRWRHRNARRVEVQPTTGNDRATS
jgi:dolichol-phosphate mannosyltransferase